MLSLKRVMTTPHIRTLSNRSLGLLLSVLLGASCHLPLYAQQHDTQLYLPILESTRKPVALTPAAAKLLALLNQERQRTGCAPLTIDSVLMNVAQAHSEDMAPSVTHVGTDGSLAGDRLEQAGYETSYWGENIGASLAPSLQEPTEEMAAEVMAGWLADQARPFYAENVRICEFTQIGIGAHTPTLTTPGTHYWVVVFAGPREPITASVIIDTTNRAEVAAAYRDLYLPTLEIPTGWSGNQVGCNAGTTSDEYREAIRFQINYFRAMAGVPATITFSEEYNQRAQATALIMSANRFLSHNPPLSALCYSEPGNLGAGSNLYSWVTSLSLSPIPKFIEDSGENKEVGHRRWLLMPEQTVMGTGTVNQRVDPLPRLPYANATYVQSDWLIAAMLGGGYRGVLQSSNPDSFVTWPPSGYVPKALIYPRWSIQHQDANFQEAQVQVTLDGNPVAVTIEYATPTASVGHSLPASALVWVPQMDWATLDMSQDHQVRVEITNIEIDGKTESFAYPVNIFDADSE